MDSEEFVREAFNKLVEEANAVLRKRGWDGRELYTFPSNDAYLKFRTQALNLVRRSCGENSDHYSQLAQIAKGSYNDYDFVACFGIVQAAQTDFENGLLLDMKSLISAEILGDFIDQAEALLNADYFVPAASLAGAVLEDTLRKTCEKYAITLPSATKIDSLNSELARANVYNKLVQKRITAIADIRNNADHGHFDSFKRHDVEDMVK